MPVKWRSKLADGAVITKGFDGSLKCYPSAAWAEIAAKLAALPQSQPEARAYVRQTLAGAVDVELDKLGRVIIPAYLRTFASLRKQTVLAGLHDHLELWDESQWSRYLEGVDANSDSSSQTLKEMGI